MKISYLALYSDLLSDLSNHLPRSVVDQKSAADAGVWPDITRRQFSSLWLAKSFFKKFKDHTSKQADGIALDKFLQSNIQCRDWRLGPLDQVCDDLLVGLFKQEIYRFFNRSNIDPIIGSVEDILQRSRPGPGASIRARGNDFYTKMFASPLSSTSKGLYTMYQHYFQRYPEWSCAEERRLDHYGVPEIVEGNRLSFVPKNEDTSRVICTEPGLNMFYQLGLGKILESRLRRFLGIDIRDQQVHNKRLARIGSRDDSYVTIDLSSASDTVSRKMVAEMFPVDVLNWLDLFRSPACTLPNGEQQRLWMMSSMGNGFTFPLETLIFGCVVSACYHASDIRMVRPQGENPGNFGVFGDDIIVDKRVANKVVRLLTLLGFTVNKEKSFFEGSFRESCGGDFFRGHPVRGVYIKSLESQANRFVAINQLNRWSAEANISLPKTIRRLMKHTRFLPVPLYENVDAGIRVPSQFITKFKKDKYCQSVIYRRWVTTPSKLTIHEGGITVPRGAKQRIYNAHGLLLGFLRGDIQNCKLGIRLGPAHYSTKMAVSPNWDYQPTVGEESPIGLARFVSAIWLNMF